MKAGAMGGMAVLAGCVSATVPAEQVIASYIAAAYPTVDANAAASCGIDHATMPERAMLQAGGTPPSLAAEQVIEAIMQRPSTRDCLAANRVALG